MHEYPLILTLTGGLSVALILGFVTQRFGLSPIVGSLLAGLLVGPHTPGFVADAQLAARRRDRGDLRRRDRRRSPPPASPAPAR